MESPWRVSRVELSVEAGRVDVWLDHPRGFSWCCPGCAAERSCRDHSEERCWRHLDTCQFETVLHARVPRVECPEHGVRQIDVAWAESRSRFALIFEHLAIEVLQQCATVTGASRLLGLSWDEGLWGIMQRAVARGLLRKTADVRRHLGVDEKAICRGHRYMTLVCDLERFPVEYVAKGRKRSSLDSFWKCLKEQLDSIQAIAMDMWLPNINSTITHLPDATKKIVFDRFHVMKHMNAAVCF